MNSIDTIALQRELRRRERAAQSSIRRLSTKRDKLASQLAELDRELAKLGHRPRSGRTRAKNEMPLAQALANLLKGKEMNVSDAAEAVQKAGYKTTAPKSFRTMVNIALLNKKLFKRVSRGIYTAK